MEDREYHKTMGKNMDALRTAENDAKKKKQEVVQAFMVDNLVDLIIATTPGPAGLDAPPSMAELWNNMFVPGPQRRQQNYLNLLIGYFADDNGSLLLGCTPGDIYEHAHTKAKVVCSGAQRAADELAADGLADDPSINLMERSESRQSGTLNDRSSVASGPSHPNSDSQPQPEDPLRSHNGSTEALSFPDPIKPEQGDC